MSAADEPGQRDARREAVLGGALLLVAVTCGLLFNGVELVYFAWSQVALWLALAVLLARRRSDRLQLPRSLLALSLTMFGVWLGISVAWSPVWYLSALNAWWIGSLVFCFWLYVLAADQNSFWRVARSGIVTLAVLLAAYALWQFYVQHDDPHATFLNRNSLAAFLNLAALSLLPYALAPRQMGLRRGSWLALTGVLFLLLLTIALSKSRGALLGLALGSAAVLWVTRRDMQRLPSALVATLGLAALVLANLSRHGAVLERLGSLDHPLAAGATRWVIWGRAWDLLWQHPWAGIGLGTFWLAWPPYRAANDTSAGFYVHNDYLQLWIEAGLPGLLLLLTVGATALWCWRRVLASTRSTVRLEAAGLGAGLAAVAFHSLFTFNLYIMPVTMFVGLVLGRLQQLACEAAPCRWLAATPATRTTRRSYALLVALVAALPIVHFASLGVAQHLVQRARTEVGTGNLLAADTLLSRAEALAPSVDTTWYVHAEFLARGLRHLPSHAPLAEREALYSTALRKLARAQALNPLRPQPHAIRAALYTGSSDLAGGEWNTLAAQEYRRALRLDPRFLPARIGLARLLRDTGQPAAAAEVLRAGLPYWYEPSPVLKNYVALTRSVLESVGDAALAGELRRRYNGSVGEGER